MSDSSAWEEAYRSSRYAFPRAGSWFEFALDGDAPAVPDLHRSVVLISACNPDSEERPQAWNEAANARLLRALVARGVDWTPAWGSSLPGVAPAWREDGFGIRGLDLKSAVEWGKEWGQQALVWLEAERSGLLLCADGSFVTCGVRLFS